MLSIKALSLTDRRTGIELVNDLSFSIRPNDRIAIIGSEGCGKSTLMNAIVFGSIPHIEMTGTITSDVIIGHMPQTLNPDDLDLTLEDLLREKAIDESMLLEAHRLLTLMGLSVEASLLSRTMSTFSGGERVKIMLARAIMNHPDLLCLDEPSNDLDFKTIEFLEDFLKNSKIPVLFISHDQRLLRQVATGIIHLRQIKGERYPLTVFSRSAYEQYKSDLMIKEDKDRMIGLKQRSDHKKKMDRFRTIYQKVEHRQNQAVRDPSTARLLKKRIHVLKSQEKRYEKEKASWREIPEEMSSMEIFFDHLKRMRPRDYILNFATEALTLKNGQAIPSIELHIKGSDKVVLTGDNGIGKTTLIKHIKAHLEDNGVTVGYIPQRYEDQFLPDVTAIDYLQSETSDLEPFRLRQMLGALGFRREDMDQKSVFLSEGQKMKVILLGITLKAVDLLLLDEPTRNISPLNLDEMARLFKSFPGPMLVVSHDRDLIQHVFDQIFVLSDEGLSLVKNIY